jgi:hypothetical protein
MQLGGDGTFKRFVLMGGNYVMGSTYTMVDVWLLDLGEVSRACTSHYGSWCLKSKAIFHVCIFLLFCLPLPHLLIPCDAIYLVIMKRMASHHVAS